jgi:hypothetical protein
MTNCRRYLYLDLGAMFAEVENDGGGRRKGV